MANPDAPHLFGMNAASAGILHGLRERFAMSVPMHVGVITAAGERILEALRSGRLDLYVVARRDLGRAMDELSDEIDNDESAMDAIQTLDPRLAGAVAPIVNRLAIEAHRREFADLSIAELLKGYAVHAGECKTKDCAEGAAYLEELHARGLTRGIR